MANEQEQEESGVLEYYEGPNFLRLPEGESLTVEATVEEIAIVRSKAYEDRAKDDEEAEYRRQLRTYFSYSGKTIPYWSMPNRSNEMTKTEKMLNALGVPKGEKVDIQSLKGRGCKLVLEGRADKPVKVLSLQRLGGPEAEVQGTCVVCGDVLSSNPKLVVGDRCLPCAQDERGEEDDLLGDGEE